MDVLRKETLIILLVASVLLLADLWQRVNPKVATTCSEKFPNILVLARLKTQICESEGKTGVDQADALILDNGGGQKLFYHHGIFLIGEDVLFAQTQNRAAGKHGEQAHLVPSRSPTD